MSILGLYRLSALTKGLQEILADAQDFEKQMLDKGTPNASFQCLMTMELRATAQGDSWSVSFPPISSALDIRL